MAAKRTKAYQQPLKKLLEAIPLPAFIIDGALSIQQVNSAGRNFCRIGTLPQQRTLDQVLPNPQILRIVQECIHTHKALTGVSEEEHFEHAWNITVTPLFDEDTSSSQQIPELYVLIIEDMAGPRHLERVQREFLANISHELRTPLTSVRLLTETLEDVIDTDPESAQKFIEKIEHEVQYLSSLVADLLELSRIESGQLPMTIEPVEAAQLVHEVRARMLPLAQRHRVRLATDIQQPHTLVAVDSKLITRAFFNLVHNSIKFTPSQGLIVIGTALQKEEQMQRFFVRDTGIGISAEELPRVFERFYKTNRARSKPDIIGPDSGGTGLGLAIARQVVEIHKGHIMAESTIGEGSTFSFTLPIVS